LHDLQPGLAQRERERVGEVRLGGDVAELDAE
jgi:hypothetical protein